MTNNLIIEGLKDAVRHARGEKARGSSRVYYADEPLDVKSIRKKLDLTQEEFAIKFGFSLASVRNWEQGRRAPAGVNKNFLKVIDSIPNEVESILAA